MKTIKVIISNKRKVSESDKGITYSTKGFGRSEIFTIAKSAIIDFKDAKIRVNDSKEDDAVLYYLKDWGYSLIKEKTDKMRSDHFTMPI